MGGKYEIIGWEYPYSGVYDLHEFTNSWWKARKLYRKAKKMFYSAWIVRDSKKLIKENIRFGSSSKNN